LLYAGASVEVETDDEWKWTPAMAAVGEGHLKVLQLLAAFKANIDFSTSWTPNQVEMLEGTPCIKEWLLKTCRWSPFEIAISINEPIIARKYLRNGDADPDMIRFHPEQLQFYRQLATDPSLVVRSSVAEWHANSVARVRRLQQLVPEGCPTTASFVKLASLPTWAPPAHWLHHSRCRETVYTVLLVSERLHQLQQSSTSGEQGASDRLLTLPYELWLCAILKWISRNDWDSTYNFD
jgi:hypothetical protein